MRIMKRLARLFSPARSGPRQPRMPLRTKALAAVAPAALCVAFAAVPAFASAQTIEFAGGGEVEPPAPIAGFSSNLKFNTEKGALECTESKVSGTLTANGGPTEGEIETGSFEGGLEPVENGVSACETSIPSPTGGTLHARIVNPATNKGPGLSGLPWLIIFRPDGTTTIVSLKEQFLDFWAILYAHIPGDGWTPVVSCHFRAESLADTYNLGGGSPLLDTLTEQEMELFKEEPVNEPPLCPASGKLNGTFTLTSEEKPLEAN